MQQPPTIPQSMMMPPQQDQLPPPPQQRGGGWRSIISTVIILIAAPLLALGLTSYVFQSYQVEGQSMESTLQNQDRLIVLKVPKTVSNLTGHSYTPKRGEIIIFVKHGLSEFGESQGDKQLIKRVIGLPGDHVVVRDGAITIYNQDHANGFNPDTEGGFGRTARLTPGDIDLTVPDGQIFVCGDNRTNSLDSRTFGPISTKDLVGKLVFRLIPVSKAKTF